MSAPRFINSAIVRVPERVVLRGGSWGRIATGVRYGMVMHAEFGPVLIDTGYGPRVTREAQRSAALKLYSAVLRPRLIEDNLPLVALRQAGYAPTDVRRIVVTHFHADHVGALHDFPNARFIASGSAWDAIVGMRKGQRVHNGIFSELMPADFANRLLPIETLPERPAPIGLGMGRDIWGDGSCLAINLPGHAIGHFGLLWAQSDPPLLYATDTTWLSDALDDRMPGGIARIVYADEAAMRKSAEMVARFRRAGGRVALCHDRVTV